MTCPSLLRRGQITVFVLLLGLLGLTIGMSAASRSLSDLKQATYTETGTKALAGAEAGLQYGLSQLNSSTPPVPRNDCDTNPAVSTYSDVTGNIGLSGFSSIKYRTCVSSQPNFSDTKAPDDVMEVDISQVNVTNVKNYRIAWDNANAAIEVAFLDKSFNINRYAFNGGAANNFSGTLSTGPTCVTSTKYVDISSNPNSAPGGALLLRVKPMVTTTPFSTVNIYVCGLDSTQTLIPLDARYFSVEVLATTTGGTVSHLKSKKSSNGLPSVFDNAWFSGGSITQ